MFVISTTTPKGEMKCQKVNLALTLNKQTNKKKLSTLNFIPNLTVCIAQFESSQFIQPINRASYCASDHVNLENSSRISHLKISFYRKQT